MTTDRRSRIGLVFLLAFLLNAMGSALAAPPLVPKPLPDPVLSQAPGIRPLGHGRHTLWGIRVYDATLWIVGEDFTTTEPHALDVESGKSVSSETLVKTATDEMSRLKLGDAARLAVWRLEMARLIPSVKSSDQIVIFCPPDGKTLTYYNGRSYGEVDDATLCPAIMNVWLHPAIMNVWLHPESRSKDLRKSLLGR
jgi:Chalcone isomerase-like